jgi:capsid portal protein
MTDPPDNIEKAREITVLSLDGEAVSTQTETLIESWGVLDTPAQAVEPPLPLEHLKGVSETSSTRTACIEVMARNTVGLGHELVLAEGHEHDEEDAERTAIGLANDLDTLASKDVRNDGPSFTDLLEKVKTDEEEIGQGYIEVARNKVTGQVSGLYHLPAERMRRLKDRTGYLLLSEAGAKQQLFYNFGDKVAYDRDGNPQPRLAKNGKRWNRNEVIRFRRATSHSLDYGLPRDHAMFFDYLADHYAVQSNVAFFEAGGVPPKAVFVRGVEEREGERITFKVPKETTKQVANILRGEGKQRARVAIIPLPPGSEVESVDLGTVSERDIGFVDFRADNKQRTVSAFRISLIFLADTSEGGRYTAEVERSITHEQVFEPEQNRYARRLRRTLLKDLGYGHYTFRFRQLAIEGDSARRESAERLAEATATIDVDGEPHTFGLIKVVEYRNAFGMPPLPEADEGTSVEEALKQGKVPFGFNQMLVQRTNAPRGAENRTLDGDDQQGLDPDVGGRRRREQPPDSVPRRVDQLQGDTRRALVGAGRRASRRARRGAIADD